MKLILMAMRNLTRSRLRTALSVFTCLIAGFLLTVLLSIPASITRITGEAASKLRVIVTAPNAYLLPIWYRDAIRKLRVAAATAELGWGAIYRDPRQPIVAYGVDTDVSRVYQEGHLTPDEIEKINHDRSAVLIGSVLMEKNHWRLGEPITLRNPDGKVH